MHLENSLLLEGDQGEIQRFVLQAKKCIHEDEEEFPNGTDFRFDRFIPMPEIVSNWREWRMAHWGTGLEIHTMYDKNNQTYYFDTEPDYDDELSSRGFIAISKLFPKIKFTYESYKFDDWDSDVGLYCKIKFCNGTIELEEKCKVRVSHYLHWHREYSHERIV